MDIIKILANLLTLLTEQSAITFVLMGIGFISYVIGAIFLGKIFSKASQPRIAAFIPLWNVMVFYKLGGYSPLWIIGSIVSSVYLFLAGYIMIANVAGQSWAVEGFAKTISDTFPIAGIVTSLLLFVTLLVGLLAAYNIGRAFERDAGYLLMFIFAFPIWLLALAFTSYDWDESSANPNSSGETDRRKVRAAAIEETKRSRAKAAEFMEPGVAGARNFDAVESDYDRAVREQEARGGIPAMKVSKKKGSKSDSGDARIVDSGSNDPNVNPEWT